MRSIGLSVVAPAGPGRGADADARLLELRREWRFRAHHLKGVTDQLADGISRWNRADISANLRGSRPDICWQEQHPGQEALAVTFDGLGSSSSESQLRTRLPAVTRRVSGLAPFFAGSGARVRSCPLTCRVMTPCGRWSISLRGVVHPGGNRLVRYPRHWRLCSPSIGRRCASSFRSVFRF